MLLTELMEARWGKVAEDEVIQEVVDENQTDLYHLMTYRSFVSNTAGMIAAKIMFEGEIRIP